MQSYYNELIEEIKSKKLSKDKINRLKLKLCKKYNLKYPPTDVEILLNASEKDIPKLKKQLLTKPTRTISGVAIIAVMSAPYECPHGSCIMCPSYTKKGIPKSYTGYEPATMRALRNKFDPYLQIFNRLEQYIVTGHLPEKIELIIMGGTFPSFPRNYQQEFIKNCFKAMNDFSRIFFKNGVINIKKFKQFFELPGKVSSEERVASIHKKALKEKNKNKKSLKREQKLNETSVVKCVGLTIETRADYGTLEHGNFLLNLGCTRIELGIQSVYDEVLKKIKRGHTVQDNIDSIRTLKDLGFKLNFHYMPGLFVNRSYDLAGMKLLFSDSDYRPDMLKIYPCIVIKGTKLYQLYKKGKFKPLTTKQAASLIADFKKFVPKYCRIMRVQRDIPSYKIVAGVNKTNLRQYIHSLMKLRNIKCSCIRCREVGRTLKTLGKITYNTIEYEASHGREFFIEAISGESLLGFCRMRFPSVQLRKEITKGTALIRELHVYGEPAALGKKAYIQHRGLGKRLLKLAEKIAKLHDKDKIVIISGVGVREYYRKQKYKKQGPYMVKKV
ncbi:tRNA uridine(34) 5-carboxymethylaminomethyl modification radical SAM/GNAT enzyme Elp3 [Candidatus Woesearchaeota archaeon]|nr:MAG: tRNA uridine(34) 5-carboxymethylaminomethyl modification radical SAM/GNAT enzyme Elp3 [Candidatus Woesearchaeota archaeon]